jgi:23S rRNA pseudouridine2605 synthase
MPVRLQKILSQWGIGSRRSAEKLIQEGRVTVNGEPAYLGQKADPDCDRIEVDGQLIQPEGRPDYHYLLLNKPLGMVSTCADPEGRPTILEALPAEFKSLGLHPVGRLDMYSTGALLLTNDGDLTYRLTHPKHDVTKTYRVCLEKRPSPKALKAWQHGMELDHQPTRPAQVRIIRQEETGYTTLEIILQEGRNRQIRRMAEAFGHRVISLHRTAIGSIYLGQLPMGAYRPLSTDEIKALLSESTTQGSVATTNYSPSVGVLHS